jgi:hypothetical protein
VCEGVRDLLQLPGIRLRLQRDLTKPVFGQVSGVKGLEFF